MHGNSLSTGGSLEGYCNYVGLLCKCEVLGKLDTFPQSYEKKHRTLHAISGWGVTGSRARA